MARVISWQEAWPGSVPSLEIDMETIGLVVVDVQGQPQPSALQDDRTRAHDVMISNIGRLLSWFRANARPVIYLRVGSFLPDAQDQHAKRRLAWGRWDPGAPEYRRPVGSPDYEIRPEIAPRPDELVLDKNATGAFNSSGIDHFLHQLGLRTLVVTGEQTYACVDVTARDAADRGYNVVLASDACSHSPGRDVREATTFRTFSRYLGAVKTTDEVLADLEALSDQARSLGVGSA